MNSPTSNSLENILECSICLSLLCEPITVSCGHTFCRVCLAQSLRRFKKQCPTCRSVCHTVAEDAPENLIIKNILLNFYNEKYMARVSETAQQKEDWRLTLPVFFYNDLMCPGEILSLHLFEPRYKLMMERVISSTRSFAYCYVASEHVTVGSIALIAGIQEAEFLSDGRCLLMAHTLYPRYVVEDIYVEPGTQGLYYVRLKQLMDEVTIPTQQAIEGNVANQSIENEARELVKSSYDIITSLDNYQFQRLLTLPPIAGSHLDYEKLSLLLLGWCHTLNPPEKLQLLQSRDTLRRLHAVHNALQLMQQIQSQPGSRTIFDSLYRYFSGQRNNPTNLQEDENVADEDGDEVQQDDGVHSDSDNSEA